MKTVSDDHSRALAYFANHCVGCGRCYGDCLVLNSLGMDPAQLAEMLHNPLELPAEVVSLIQQCSLCGLCSRSCPFSLNPGDLMQSARQSLMAGGMTLADSYLPMLVDRRHHFFSLFRHTWQIDYTDLKGDSGSTLFFPGCSLASFAPGLTRAVYDWLQQRGMDVGFSDSCCGLPLLNIGLAERSEAHVDRLRDGFEKAGVGKIISACPNCYYHFQNQFPGIEVISLYQLLEEDGIKIPAGMTATVHDSCPDRYTGAIGASVRAILADSKIIEMEHHGADTMCCGAGGIVSMVAPETSQQRAELRIGEIRTMPADICVSSCMGCVKRLHSEEDDTPAVVHLLELIFNQKIDHILLQDRLESMWQGERGRRNLELMHGLCGEDEDDIAEQAENVRPG